MNKAFLLNGKISCISCAVLVLTACGEGSGYSPTPPPDQATYAVGGMVAGLAGSGLLLRLDIESDDATQPISANGSFSFGPHVGIGTGTKYNVTVATQPTNPSQTCVVTNGSGTMGSSNVTNVSVTCTTPNLANAKLTGTYKVVKFSVPSPYDYGYTGDFSDLLTLTFDGAGNFSGTDVQSGDGVVSSSTVSGTYTVTVDGTLTITSTGESAVTGRLSANGNTLVASRTTANFYPSVLFGIKQGQSNFSNTNLTGTYTTVRYDYNSAGDVSGLSSLTFDGAGNFTGTETLNNGGLVSSMAISGTCTVAADGTLTLTSSAGSTLTGGLSADGSTLVASRTTASFGPSVLFGIKQGQTNSSNADLMGAYKVIDFATRDVIDGLGDRGGLSTVTFDGAGNHDDSRVLNDAGSITSGVDTGTYTVAMDGTLTIKSSAGYTTTGGLSADGNTLVTTQVTNAQGLAAVVVGIK
jgi:large repetitive protein